MVLVHTRVPNRVLLKKVQELLFRQIWEFKPYRLPIRLPEKVCKITLISVASILKVYGAKMCFCKANCSMGM